MSRYLVLYLSSASAEEQMSSSTPEQAQAGIDAWNAWNADAGAAVADLGAPLAYRLSVPSDAGRRDGLHVGGYSILEAESTADVERLLDGHPHFGAPDATVEVHEILTMPGA